MILRMLRLVPERKPWQRLNGEPEFAYQAFCVWLLAEPRPAPERRWTAAARKYSWSERSEAYDASQAIERGDPLEATAEALIEVAQHESRKLLARARTGSTALTPKELVLILAWVSRAEDLLAKLGGSAKLDLSALSEAEYERVKEVHALLKKG